MPRSKIINLACGDIAPADMTLKLGCSADELNESQLAAYDRAEKEHNDIKAKLRDLVSTTSAENVFLGEIFSAYEVAGAVEPEVIEEISEPVSAVRRVYRSQQAADEKRLKAQKEREASRRRENTKNVQVIDDDDDDESARPKKREADEDFDDDDYVPLSKRVAAKKAAHAKEAPKKGGFNKIIIGSDKIAFNKPNEGAAIGGLCIGEKTKDVVDLTKEEAEKSKSAADSREISFNKLQGKTFPSLVAIARPMLKTKEINTNDRPVLDAKVKSVLMHNAAMFTEWLIQQGLVRSEQYCQIHPRNVLKLGVYSDYAKFQYSGGYVWISDCCASRFVSVFNGSIFEGATQPPTVIVKLIYHWSCQTNVQNVVQWVKVENLYVKTLYTWLRAICTMALWNHLPVFGGSGVAVEIGVISLGTTSQGGQQKQVKVEVLGILDPARKLVRLRAIEPVTDGDKNYKKRFAKIFEPLAANKWVHKESTILTDLTVDKSTLIAMGFKTILQTPRPDGKNQNATIMEYLRTVVPRMFQNTLSLLSRPIIQQFLDELVWREWFGTSPGKAFDNIVQHIASQSTSEQPDSLIVRLNKVSANPFVPIKFMSRAPPPKPTKASVKSLATVSIPSTSASVPKKTTTPSAKQVPTVQIPSVTESRLRITRNKRRELSPSPSPPPRRVAKTPPAEKNKVGRPPLDAHKVPSIKIESYYYGLFETGTENDSAISVPFEANCPECHHLTRSNNELMDHLKAHVNAEDRTETSVQCRYCLVNVVNHKLLDEHLNTKHPTKSKIIKFYCLICSIEFGNIYVLRNHMHNFHRNAELPFKCGCCDHMSSSQRHTIDHFYSDHTTSGAVQCPFCLRMFVVVAKSEQMTANIEEYYKHLKDHMAGTNERKCSFCSLRFLAAGPLMVHQQYDHETQKWHIQCQLRELCSESVEISGPKNKKTPRLESVSCKMPLNDVTMYIDNGMACIECGEDFQEPNHFRGLSNCPKCSYRTACSRTLFEHIERHSSGTVEASTSLLEREMFCVCGLSSSEGNSLAKHLLQCDRKSAYPSRDEAEAHAYRKKLVERDEDDEDSSSAPEIPVDQQQQLLSKSIEDGNQTETESIDGTRSQAISSMDDFNTQLSLDDLAPASVAPPHNEPDRTPQLSDEYQSLATPRVSTYTTQYDSNDYDMQN